MERTAVGLSRRDIAGEDEEKSPIASNVNASQETRLPLSAAMPLSVMQSKRSSRGSTPSSVHNATTHNVAPQRSSIIVPQQSSITAGVTSAGNSSIEEMNGIFKMHLDQLMALDKATATSVIPEQHEVENILNFRSFRFTLYDKLIWPCQVIYVTLELENSSTLAWILSIVLKIVILLAIFVGVVSSEPSFNYIPDNCAVPVCDNDPKLCRNMRLCAPQPLPAFDTIEDVCFYVFMIEYGLKIATCWTVSPLLAGLAVKEDATTTASTGSEVHFPVSEQRQYTVAEQVIRWVFRLKNLIDLACWLPFLVGMIVKTNVRQSTFVRALRLLRLIRILRMVQMLRMFESIHAVSKLLKETCINSWPAVAAFFFFLFMVVILFGNVIYYLEQGTFVVNDDYPTGAYVRPTIDHHHTEPSPFVSIGTSFYWVIVTGATVGYGDLVPTSYSGRALAGLTCFLGIIGLAFPVGVLSAEFTAVYTAHHNAIYERIKDEKNRIAEEKRNLKRAGGAKALKILGEQSAKSSGKRPDK